MLMCLFLCFVLFLQSFKRKVMAPTRMADTRNSPRMDLRASPSPSSSQYLRLKKNRSEGYGLRLGYTLFVEGVNEYGVAGANGLKKGDKIMRVSFRKNNVKLTLAVTDGNILAV